MRRVRTWREVLVDYMLYVAIGVFLVASVLWGAMHDVPSNRLIFGWFTALVFGIVIATYRAWLRSGRFWTVLSCMLLMHVAVFAPILPHGLEVRAGWYGWVVLPLELVAIDAALGRAGIRPRRIRRASSGSRTAPGAGPL